MGTINPRRHPLLHHVAQGAQYLGSDDFPAWEEWAEEYERWLKYLHARGVLDLYAPRLRGPSPQPIFAFAEIGAAYFLETRGDLPVLTWEPPGAGGTRGEFLLAVRPVGQVFTEVKSPTWEAEIARLEGQGSPRLLQPKYISEARATDPVGAVRGVVARAHRQMPGTMPTLLVLHDNLIVPLNEWPHMVRIALYHPRDGCFSEARHERFGGVGVLNVLLKDGAEPEYQFRLFENPHALPVVALPKSIFEGYPRINDLA